MPCWLGGVLQIDYINDLFGRSLVLDTLMKSLAVLSIKVEAALVHSGRGSVVLCFGLDPRHDQLVNRFEVILGHTAPLYQPMEPFLEVLEFLSQLIIQKRESHDFFLGFSLTNQSLLVVCLVDVSSGFEFCGLGFLDH